MQSHCRCLIEKWSQNWGTCNSGGTIGDLGCEKKLPELLFIFNCPLLICDIL